MYRPFAALSAALVLFLLVTGAPLAREGAERTLSVEHPVGAGDALIVENLLGSVRVVPSESTRSVKVEARIVAEAKTQEEARALVESIRIEPRTAGNVTRFHVAFPVDRISSFRPPKRGVKGMISRWTGSMLRESSTVEYDGRTVQVGADRKATGLAVHLTVTLPYEMETSIRQAVGSIEGSALRGTLRLETLDGEIAFERCFGVLHAVAGRGTVRVLSFQGEELRITTEQAEMELVDVRTERTRLSSGSGTISGSRVTSAELVIESASGDVKLGAVEPTTVQVKTGSGKVDLASHMKTLRDAVIQTATGDVTLRLGPLTHFDLLAESKSGAVKTLGMSLDVVAQEGLSTRLQHGQGGTDLRVAAPGGSVTVRPFEGSRLDLLVGN